MTMRLVTRYVPAVLFLAALIVAWDIAVRAFDLQPYLLPGPGRVWHAFLEVRGTLPGHIRTTMTEALLGLGIACVLGAGIAALLAGFAPVRRVVYPLLVVSQNVPMIVMAPLIVVWFGFGIMPKALVVALICFFPTLVNMVRGLQSVSPQALELARILSASKSEVFWKIRLPSSLPFLFSALKIAATTCVIGAIVGEWVGADLGLGALIIDATFNFRSALLYATVFLSSGLSVLMFAAVSLTEKLVVRW